MIDIQKNRERVKSEAILSHFSFSNRSVIVVAPRVGKTGLSIEVFKKTRAAKILVVYPTNDIKKGWMDECERLGFPIGLITFSTTNSLHKIKDEFDYLVLDEIHSYSPNELQKAAKIQTKGILGLTGTLTKTRENRINKYLGLNVSYRYGIEEAVNDGILVDYQINIHKVPLEKREKGKFTKYSYAAKKLEENNKSTLFLDLKRTSILQSSVSKQNKTVELLNKYKGERIIVFCGLTEIADNLGIHSYHSKNKDKELLESFCIKGEISQLACCQMLSAGIKILPINRAIINYTSGNPEDCAQKIARILAYEFDNKDKKAEIDFICTEESFDLVRVETALAFFNPQKINWVN